MCDATQTVKRRRVRARAEPHLARADALLLTFDTNGMMSTQLFGVSPVDSATSVVVVMLMIGTAGISALIPARRAANVDPLTALRYE